MPNFEQDIDNGFRSALTRWASEIDIAVDYSQLTLLEEHRSLTLVVLGDYEARSGHLGRLGVTMFAEWVAIAAIIRIAHDEPPLQRDHLDAFLPAATEMLNTAFCHPPMYLGEELPTVGGLWPSGTANVVESDEVAESELHFPKAPEAGAPS